MMKFWNDIDGSTFFNQVYNTPVAIGTIELFTISIDNSRPTIILEFDIEELPDSHRFKLWWSQQSDDQKHTYKR